MHVPGHSRGFQLGAVVRWIEKGLDHNTQVTYEAPAAKALYERVKARREGKPQ